MGIILGIMQSFLNATGMILNKRVSENKSLSNDWQIFISRFSHLIFLGVFFIFLGIFFDLEALKLDIDKSLITSNNILLFLVATIGIYITYPLRRIAYANEKVSVLQPFAMLYQIFPVILGFIFLSTERANIITFLVSILASFIVIIPNIDFKNFKINKYSLMVLASSTIKSGQIFIILYLLTILKPSNLYFIESILIIIISFSLILFKKDFPQIKNVTKQYGKLLITTNFIIVISILLALTMFSTLGIVLTSLLSLLYLVFIYILGYFILKEIPKKKDVIITILVSICIIIGIIFKN